MESRVVKPVLMHLIAIFSTHLRVTGSKQSTAAGLSSAMLVLQSYKFTILQSGDSRDSTQGSGVFSEYENPFIIHPAEVPFSKTLNHHHRQIKECVV